MIKVLQRGKNLNSIYSLFDKIVVKKYSTKNQSNRELEGVLAWGEICPNVPKKYLKLWRIILFEQISSQKNLTRNQKVLMLKNLANIYLDLINSYKYHNSSDDKHYLSWDRYLNNNFDNYFNNKKIFQRHLNNSEIRILENTLVELKNIDWSGYPKLPLHRDIHWGNLLMEKDSIRVIDFEHFCIGPLEYEFCNSIFWDDEYSINFKKFCDLLNQRDIEINKNLAYKMVIVYFIEQLLLASQDPDKIYLLINKFKFFRKKYLGSLKFNFNQYTEQVLLDSRNQEIQNQQLFLEPSYQL